MDGPEVSVVIPTHNRVGLLGDTLRSVLSQRGVDVQVVVVDDGSTDATADYLDNLVDPRVEVVHHAASLGVSQARNAGVAASEAEWVAFIDDDDVWAPGKLVTQVRAMEQQPGASWSYVGTVDVDPRLRIIGWTEAPSDTDVAMRMLDQDIVPGGGSGVVLSRELLRAAGGFDPSLSCRADWDLWIRLAQESPVAPVNRPLLGRRVHRGSMSLDVAHCDREFELICDKYADLRAEHDLVPDRTVELRWQASMYVRAGRRRSAVRSLRRIARVNATSRGLGRAALMAVLPGSVRMHDFRMSRKVPAAWREEAEAWLRPLR